jgi:phosphotransferase system enzyme I (PtsP)
MAMGFDVLSMNATTLLRVKAVIRTITLESAKELLEQVMALDDSQSIRSCVDMALYNAGVDRLLRSPRNH